MKESIFISIWPTLNVILSENKYKMFQHSLKIYCELYGTKKKHKQFKLFLKILLCLSFVYSWRKLARISLMRKVHLLTLAVQKQCKWSYLYASHLQVQLLTNKNMITLNVLPMEKIWRWPSVVANIHTLNLSYILFKMQLLVLKKLFS